MILVIVDMYLIIWRGGTVQIFGNNFNESKLYPGRKKLGTDWSWGMLAIIRCRSFWLPVCYPKT